MCETVGLLRCFLAALIRSDWIHSVKHEPTNRIITLEMWVCVWRSVRLWTQWFKCFLLLFSGWCFGGWVWPATDSCHINKERIKTTALQLKNTFICRVTFIHGKPFDLRTLRFWSCVGLHIVTTTVLACGLVTYWTFFKNIIPLSSSCLTLVSLVRRQYYAVIIYFHSIFIPILCVV